MENKPHFTVLMLTSSFPRYEGDYFGPWVLEYARELVRQGCKVFVVAPRVGKHPIEILSHDNLVIKRFNYWPLHKNQKLAHPPGLIPQLKSNYLRFFQVPAMLQGFYKAGCNIIKNNPVDIIHAQWVIPGGYIGMKLKHKFKIPLLVTSQGAEFYLSKYHPFSWFTRYTLKNTDVLLAVSKQMAVRSLQYGANQNQVKVIPNAVNTNIFRPDITSDFRNAHDIPDDATVILTIRRLVKEKRVQDIIQAVALLKKKENLYIVIGGDGPERNSLEQLVDQLGLKKITRFIGFIDNASLPPIYTAANIYILSSQQEGLSLSLLEAMASGCQVISTRGTGGDDMGGISYYEVANIADLVRCLENVMTLRVDQPVDRQSISVQNMTARLLKIYSQLK